MGLDVQPPPLLIPSHHLPPLLREIGIETLLLLLLHPPDEDGAAQGRSVGHPALTDGVIVPTQPQSGVVIPQGVRPAPIVGNVSVIDNIVLVVERRQHPQVGHRRDAALKDGQRRELQRPLTLGQRIPEGDVLEGGGNARCGVPILHHYGRHIVLHTVHEEGLPRHQQAVGNEGGIVGAPNGGEGLQFHPPGTRREIGGEHGVLGGSLGIGLTGEDLDMGEPESTDRSGFMQVQRDDIQRRGSLVTQVVDGHIRTLTGPVYAQHLHGVVEEPYLPTRRHIQRPENRLGLHLDDATGAFLAVPNPSPHVGSGYAPVHHTPYLLHPQGLRLPIPVDIHMIQPRLTPRIGHRKHQSRALPGTADRIAGGGVQQDVGVLQNDVPQSVIVLIVHRGGRLGIGEAPGHRVSGHVPHPEVHLLTGITATGLDGALEVGAELAQGVGVEVVQVGGVELEEVLGGCLAVGEGEGAVVVVGGVGKGRILIP